MSELHNFRTIIRAYFISVVEQFAKLPPNKLAAYRRYKHLKYTLIFPLIILSLTLSACGGLIGADVLAVVRQGVEPSSEPEAEGVTRILNTAPRIGDDRIPNAAQVNEQCIPTIVNIAFIGSVRTPEAARDRDTTPIACLQIDKDDAGIIAFPGETITYTLTYTNAGTEEVEGVIITETVPENTIFDAEASTPGWSCRDRSPPGTTCSFQVGVLPPRGNGTVDFAVEVDSFAPQPQ